MQAMSPNDVSQWVQNQPELQNLPIRDNLDGKYMLDLNEEKIRDDLGIQNSDDQKLFMNIIKNKLGIYSFI